MATKVTTMKHCNASKGMRIACLIILTAGANACTVLPAGLAGRTIIEKDSLELIQVGQTSKQELQQTLGPPDWSINGGSRWIYRTRRRGDYGVSGCVVFPDDGGELRCSKPKVAPVMEFVDLGFDSSGVVDTQDFFSIKSGTCAESIGCFHWTSNMLTLFAPSDDNVDAKQFPTNAGQCAVYLYSVDTINAVEIYSDSFGTHGRYWSNTGFVRLTMDAGPHTITVSYSTSFDNDTRSLKFDCVSGGTNFMREHHRGYGNFSFDELPSDEGRREIKDRNLVVLPDLE